MSWWIGTLVGPIVGPFFLLCRAFVRFLTKYYLIPGVLFYRIVIFLPQGLLGFSAMA